MREFGVGRNQAAGALARERLLTPHVPARVEAAPGTVAPLLRRLVRRVARAGTEVCEEGLVGIDVAQITDERDRMVDEILGEVVAVGNGPGRVDEVVVVHEGGRVLVRLAGEEAVEPFESASQRPAVPWCREVALVVGREVPLPDGPGRVAVRDEDLREERIGVGDARVVAGEARREIRDAAHAVGVVVAPGHQARPGGRAERGRVEVAIAEPAGRERVEGRRVEIAAEAAELREADVVEDDQQDIGRIGGCAHRFRPPRRRIPVVTPDRSLELARLHGTQALAVKTSGRDSAWRMPAE